MRLLHWSTLAPEGPSGLAAIRFAAPIRIVSIRIFPKGVLPFAECPDAISRTEPEAFFFNVFFNALPSGPSDSKEKQRAPNALVPTKIAYAGGQMDFIVDMGAEYATRLVVVQGDFQLLSMALYGEIVASSNSSVEQPPLKVPPPSTTSTSQPYPLSREVDPSNSIDPTSVAEELLASLEDKPPLSLLVKLIFCLKPQNEDWDLDDFPYLYADLDSEIEEDEIGQLTKRLNTPIFEDTSQELLDKLASRVSELLGPKDLDQAIAVADLLSVAAAQIPALVSALMQHLDLENVFDPQTFDEVVLTSLLQAASNPIIAGHLTQSWFFEFLHSIQVSSTSDSGEKYLAYRIASRLQCWRSFQDALSNTQGDFTQSMMLIKDIATDEHSFGCWLLAMISHKDLVAKLEENPVLPIPSYPPSLERIVDGDQYTITLSKSGESGGDYYTYRPTTAPSVLSPLSHEEFINFVRASIGVAGVLTVWAWADSLGRDDCREWALAILNLWQDVDGYREIINHFLLLRQFSLRLGWAIPANEQPHASSLLAEKIITNLAEEPKSFISHAYDAQNRGEGFIQTILDLKGHQSLSFISDQEADELAKVARMVEGGLSSAVAELLISCGNRSKIRSIHHNAKLSLSTPYTKDQLRILRVALGVLHQEVRFNDVPPSGVDIISSQAGEGDWKVLQSLWDNKAHGILGVLIGLLQGVTEDLHEHFVLYQGASTQAMTMDPWEGLGTQSSYHPSAELLPLIPRRMDQKRVEQLFRSCEEILQLVQYFAELDVLTSWEVRSTTKSCVEIFTCTDLADALFNNGTQAQSIGRYVNGNVNGVDSDTHGGSGVSGTGGGSMKVILQVLRKRCPDILKGLTKKDRAVEPRSGKCAAEIVLRCLIGVAKDGGRGRDPANHVMQAFVMIDHLLPEPGLANGVAQPSSHEKAEHNEGRGEEKVGSGEEEMYADGEEHHRGTSESEAEDQSSHWVTVVFPNILQDLKAFFNLLDCENKHHFFRRLVQVDNGFMGLGEWFLVEELKDIQQSLEVLDRPILVYERRMVLQYRVSMGLRFLSDVVGSRSLSPWFFQEVLGIEGSGFGEVGEVRERLRNIFKILKEGSYASPYLTVIVQGLLHRFTNSPTLNEEFSPDEIKSQMEYKANSLLLFLRGLQAQFHTEGIQGFVSDIYDESLINLQDTTLQDRFSSSLREVLAPTHYNTPQHHSTLEPLRLQIGKTLAAFAHGLDHVEGSNEDTVLGFIYELLETLFHASESRWKILTGISTSRFQVLSQRLSRFQPPSQSHSLQPSELLYKFTIDEDEQLDQSPDVIHLPKAPDGLSLSISDIEKLISYQDRSEPCTPPPREAPLPPSDMAYSPDKRDKNATINSGGTKKKSGTRTPDILGIVISPPTALLRSPAATGLTKTYTKNDFRQLRQIPSARQNTSRLPSTHVDDFEFGAPPNPNLPTTLPVGQLGAAGLPTAATALSAPLVPIPLLQDPFQHILNPQ